MWTPRRILLLLLGLLAFGGAYMGYARLLGSIDGLPTLPARYLSAVVDVAPVPLEVISPTDARLMEAFGPNCPEKNYAAYPTKIELREDGIVFAAGRPQWDKEPSRFVTLAPFSVALFGKPRPPGERLPGEVTEISTIHSDKAILEFDRVVGSEKDMLSGRARMIGVELRHEPTAFSTDRRTGRIYITNNQRSTDPNKSLVFITPGPVFYRAPDPAAPPNPNAPHIWTTAAVQIENRENMPRPLRGVPLPVVAVKGDDPLPGSIVADMLLGSHTPPPTITAEGMKIYLKPPPPAPVVPGKKTKGPSFGGLRAIELNENVLMNLWVDGKSGFPGGGDADANAPKKALDDPPYAALAVVGGASDGGTLAKRLAEKSLVRIRTMGPFRYDYETNLARFDIAPQTNPLLPNNVEVTRLSALGARDYLVCQRLELELDGPLTQGGAPPKEPVAKKERASGPAFRSVRATGSYVYLYADAEQLEAQGTSLVYRTNQTDPKYPRAKLTLTVLTGAPLVAVRQRNKLEAGRPNLPGELTLTSIEPPATLQLPKPPSQTHVFVRGPGRVELYDAATKQTNLRALWDESLEQTKDKAGDKELDQFVFTGNGRFEDPKGDFDLTADVLRLWLLAGKGTPNQPLPFRLQGVKQVRGKSADAIIRDTDLLNVYFQDIPPPPVVPVQAAPAKPAVVVAQTPPPPGVPVAPKPAPPPKKSNPMTLSARSVEAWVLRFPDVGAKDKASVKYEIDRARCEDRVRATQPPADPAKNPNGMLITGVTLNLTHFPAGHAMTVVGTPEVLAEVHFENVKLAGPQVDIHQPNNTVDVLGRGWLRMPSSSDLNGTALAKPSDLHIVWTERMKFRGERRLAEFLGQVQAEQRTDSPGDAKNEATWSRSYAVCARMDVGFDQPIYFNQLRPTDDKAPKKDSPKVETVVCHPAPEDGEGVPGQARTAVPVVFAEETFRTKGGKPVKAQRIEARMLELKTNDNRTHMVASGPGESRSLQLGAKDQQQPAAKPGTKPNEEELKLTVVRFAGKLRVRDEKGIFQQAIFEENVRVINVASDDLNLRAEDTAPPLGAVTLRCTDTLTVSGYKEKDGKADRRDMAAVGAAVVQDDRYIGRGNTINYDGALVILRGFGTDQATLYRRVRTYDGQDSTSGREIKYDTRTGAANAIDSSGGSFSSGK